MKTSIFECQTMNNIPIRKINVNLVQPGFFTIRELEGITEGKDLDQDLHRHEYYLIMAIHKGKGLHEIDFTEYNISDHTIFVMRPGQVHQLHIKEGSSGILLQFGSDFYDSQVKGHRDALNSCRETPYLTLAPDQFVKIYRLLENCLSEFRNKEDNYYEMIRLNIIQFFYEYSRMTAGLNKKNEISNNDYNSEKGEEFMNLLEQNMTSKKNVSDYAELMNLSVFQLNSILLKTYGKRCTEIINEQIILESKRQLLATSDQVSRIAYNLGYDDVSYFIRFFKKQMGITPESFRKNSK